MTKPRTIDLNEDTEIELYSDHMLMHIGKLSYSVIPDANDQTLKNAEDLGYKKTYDGVFAALVENEVFHTLVARIVYKDKDSLVLLQNAGRKVELPRWKKLHSEAIVIALQYYLNTHIVLPPLDPWLVMPFNGSTLANLARLARSNIDMAAVLPIEEKQVKQRNAK